MDFRESARYLIWLKYHSIGVVYEGQAVQRRIHNQSGKKGDKMGLFCCWRGNRGQQHIVYIAGYGDIELPADKQGG